MNLLQGSQLRRQRAWAWAETPQVVIGTPVELLDMIQYVGLPRISSIKTVVVDEVDACLVHKSGTKLQGRTTARGNTGDSKALSSSLHTLLSKYLSPTYADESDEAIHDDGGIVIKDDTGNSDSTTTIPKRKIQQRQTIFASATIPQRRHFLKQCKSNQWTLEEPMFVCTSPGEALPPTLKHGYMLCQAKERKISTLKRIVQRVSSPNNKVLVFFDSGYLPLEGYGAMFAADLDGGVLYRMAKSSWNL